MSSETSTPQQPAAPAAQRGSKRYRQLDAHIGQGTYGKVERALDLQDQEEVAIKKVKVDPISENFKIADGVSAVAAYGIHFTVIREIKLMREFSHPNVMALKDVFVEREFVNLVMPHMATDLRHVLEKRVRFSEVHVKCIIRMLLLGVEELHGHYFMHRDLSPANVFVAADGCCKIADFGLSRMFGSPRPQKKTPRVVTLWYRAPELLFGAPYYQNKVDVWSLGCIFGELLNGGRPLFPGTNELDQLAKIFAICGTPDYRPGETPVASPSSSSVSPKLESDEEVKDRPPPLWPVAAELPLFVEFTHTQPRELRSLFPSAGVEALDLLAGMLTLDPMKRLTCTEALSHAYFQTIPKACDHSELPLKQMGLQRNR